MVFLLCFRTLIDVLIYSTLNSLEMQMTLPCICPQWNIAFCLDYHNFRRGNDRRAKKMSTGNEMRETETKTVVKGHQLE